MLPRHSRINWISLWLCGPVQIYCCLLFISSYLISQFLSRFRHFKQYVILCVFCWVLLTFSPKPTEEEFCSRSKVFLLSPSVELPWRSFHWASIRLLSGSRDLPQSEKKCCSVGLRLSVLLAEGPSVWQHPLFHREGGKKENPTAGF